MSSSERDRDAAGRPRNARPRDRLGRPLPPGSPDAGREPDDAVLEPGPALRRAQDLLDAGLPFRAHEVLEAVWKTADDPARPLWRGLAQVAVGLTHRQRGNATGAAALLRRGARTMLSAGPVSGAVPAGLDPQAVAAAARQAADAVDAGAEDVPVRLLPPG